MNALRSAVGALAFAAVLLVGCDISEGGASTPPAATQAPQAPAAPVEGAYPDPDAYPDPGAYPAP
ncbi:MAG: hypothetical protein RLZZ387_5196 [Chloroflexota bacterium]|jgi:hypothetical protein